MKQKLWVNIFFGITLCFGVGYIASMATQISVSTWYKALEKPFLPHQVGYLLRFGAYFIF